MLSVEDAVSAPARDRPQLAFFRVIGGNPPRYDVVLSDGAGRGVRVLVGDSKRGDVRPELFGRVAWSPDGRRIAFTGVVDERAFKSDIYVMNADGSGRRRLTRLDEARDPVWSPDGRTIVFSRGRQLSSCGVVSSLWTVSADDARVRRLTQRRPQTSEVPGSFSPGGRSLAFTRADLRPAARVDGGCRFEREVVVLDLTRSRERQLSDDGADPAFSPDGKQIALVSTRDANGTLSYGDRTIRAAELYVMRSDGTGRRRLTRTHALNESSPSWLSDGSRLAYDRGKVTHNAEAKAIFEINSDGSCPTAVLTDSTLRTWYAEPAWRAGHPRRGGGPLRCATR